MAQVSRFKLPPDKLDRLFTLFFQVVGLRKSKEDFMAIISDVLSPSERIMIAKRIAIIYLLLKKISQRQISATLKVSLATVSKFSLLLDRRQSIVTFYNKALTNDKLNNFIESIFDIFFSPGTPGVDWGSARKRQYYQRKRKEEGI